MVENWIFVFGVLILGIVSQEHNKKLQSAYQCSAIKNIYHYNNQYGVAFICLIVVFIFFSGFRYYVGTDFGAYYKANVTWDEVIYRIKTLDEPVIWFITWLVRLVVDDGVMVIFVESLITISLVFYGILQYDEGHITASSLLYIFVGSLSFAYNGVRQGMAVAFLFAFSKKSGKYWIFKYILIVFIGFLIHKSAIFLLPIFLIAQRKIDVKQIILLIIGSVMILLLFDELFQLMDITLENQDAFMYATHRINPLRIAVAFAPVIMLVIAKNNKEFLDKYYFLINMAIINAVLTLITSRSALMARMFQYTCIFLPLYIPKFKCFFRTNMDKLIFMGTVLILYAIFWQVEMGRNFVFQWSFSHFGEY